MRSAPLGFDLREVLDSARDVFGVNRQAAHPDSVEVTRAGVLASLADSPGHGLEVVRRLGARGRTAAAGAVYPVLQQLVDEGLAAADQVGERRVYTLTPAGRAAATDLDPAAGSARSSAPRGPRIPELGVDGTLARAALSLASTVAQVARDGSPEQRERAAALLDEARKNLYAVLGAD